MNDRDRLAADLHGEYELGDYWVSRSRLADAAYRGRDPMDDWRGLADRLIALGWHVHAQGEVHVERLDEERLARALHRGLCDLVWFTTVDDVSLRQHMQSHREDAAAILAALPPDWCGHKAELDDAWLTMDNQQPEIARLRRIEEAAGEYLATLDGPLSARYSRSVALATLRAALEEKP